ncbi:Spo11/DNA topoisomerase VI subunit A [Lasiosphaeria hispida]|uniref:DNA topoisomerase (ATP-hydrolyzing) n=1 Tax=Lasiosphaeria hispida TaxID=260671 RepID=A0AAJ0HQU4_9PEZI|nr:Spo11/DNA topoisomerase VI subunit A [Lasiosphaeria hispida]
MSLLGLPHAHSRALRCALVPIPCNGSGGGALSQIETLLESILDAISNGDELAIPYRTVRSTRGEDRGGEVVRFPGRTAQEAKRFAALFRIIELSHEALVSGNLITKRNIYYQNIDMFKSQAVVDNIVDNLAFTLGVGRGDLNIVAAAKGLISGDIEFLMRGGAVVQCGLSRDSGFLLPSINSIDKIDFRATEWLLVIEKEATFRTLAASQFTHNCRAGQGVIITAKGFPDLATRRFLCTLSSVRPELRLFALVDFDPHGIAILRTFQNGSKRLEHEDDVTVPHMRWLGVRSGDIISHISVFDDLASQGTESQSSQEVSSQESLVYSEVDSQLEGDRPAKRQKIKRIQDASESIAPLTQGDRKKAIDVMKDICAGDGMDLEVGDLLLELQMMMMLNMKAEIQAVDNFGNITEWLDEKLEEFCLH